MSPLEIEIMLHYFCRLDDYRDGDFSAPAVVEALKSHCENNLLQRYDPDQREALDTRSYITTERGDAYIQAITSLGLPKQVWVMDDA